MKYYVDCEFDGHNGPLLSIALVRETAFGIHIQTDAEATDPWVIENVMPVMDKHNAWEAHKGIPEDAVGELLRQFIGPDGFITFVADSPVDIWRLCKALSTAPDGTWRSCDYESLRLRVKNVDCWPCNMPSAVRHNAWWDAMALREKLS